MRQKWPQLAYIGLYSGAGRASIEGADRIVETSALSVLRLPNAFTHHVFVDNNPDCISALDQRSRAVAPTATVSLISKDVNESVPAVRAALPSWSRTKGLLSFCFVDPFDTTLKFDTIRGLSDLRIDFMVLLMLGNDARRNFDRYFRDPNSTRIADLTDCPSWRDEYKNDGRSLRFVLRKFDEAMQRVGYPGSTRDDLFPVYATGTKVLLYMLACYSKSPAGRTLWQNTLKSLARLDTQASFEFGDS
jgi:three-Cys-motif partner protein